MSSLLQALISGMTAPSWGRQYRPVDPTVPLDGQAKEVNYGPDSRLELHTSFPEMHIALIVLAILKTEQILGF